MWKEPFVLSWKGLTNAVGKPPEGMGPSTLISPLSSPTLHSVLVERGWDRQRKREKCSSHIPATQLATQACLCLRPWCFP